MKNNRKKKLNLTWALIICSFFFFTYQSAHAQTLGFADVVLEFYDSGAGPMDGPYGRNSDTSVGDVPVSVSTDVVLGTVTFPFNDFLSLPTGSYVTVGFLDETVIDGDGDDIFIFEQDASGEEADVYVSSNNVDFTFLGRANDGVSTSFDLADIGFTDPVSAVRIVGRDNLGGSPGFDVILVQVLSGSIGDPPEVLRTPIHNKFNTFLGQSNYLELTSAGSEGFPVEVSLYNLSGSEITSTTINLDANSQFDVDLNTMLTAGCTATPSACSGLEDLDGNGVIDTYGVVRLDFFSEAESDNKVLLGRVSNYKLSTDGTSYDFVFAKELGNPNQGTSYSTANTFHPLGGGVIPNWAEIINLEDSSKSFTYNLYTMTGDLALSSNFTLPSFGERDLQAGHEITDSEGILLPGVYLAEVIPDDTSADYLFSVSRYSINADNSYNYAFAVNASGGAVDTIYAPITNEDRSVSDCALTTNWLEVVNILDSAVDATVVFRDTNGDTVDTQTATIEGKAQFHFNVSAILSSGVIGLAEITSSTVNSLIAQSLVYYQDCDRNQLQTAYVVQAKSEARSTSATGTLNTFLGMQSLFRAFSTSASSVSDSYDVTPFGSSTVSESLSLSAYAGEEIEISNNDTFSFPTDTYGTIQLDTDTAGDVFGQTLRIRRKTEAGRTRLDFVMPGLLR